jgi:competence protein ComEA
MRGYTGQTRISTLKHFASLAPLQLDTLPGVGPVRAAAIVAWRNANGKFTSVDQLGEVDGIGPGRLEKLRPLVRV